VLTAIKLLHGDVESRHAHFDGHIDPSFLDGSNLLLLAGPGPSHQVKHQDCGQKMECAAKAQGTPYYTNTPPRRKSSSVA
jgi:hypothetical protein